MSYSSIAWLPLAAGLTILGLVLSYLAYRRRGLRPALMGTAWSLLPIAAYLTGAIKMIWQIGAAIGSFGTAFVFSPSKWAGIGVTGLAIALFLAAGGRARRRTSREARRVARQERDAADGPQARAGVTAGDPGRSLATRSERTRTAVPATASPQGKGARRATAPADDDDLRDIEDILRKRGI